VVRGEFTPVSVRLLTASFGTTNHSAFIGCPGADFPYTLAEFGGMRIITSHFDEHASRAENEQVRARRMRGATLAEMDELASTESVPVDELDPPALSRYTSVQGVSDSSTAALSVPPESDSSVAIAIPAATSRDPTSTPAAAAIAVSTSHSSDSTTIPSPSSTAATATTSATDASTLVASVVPTASSAQSSSSNNVDELHTSHGNPLSNPTHGGAVGDARMEVTDRVAQRQQALAVLTDADTVLGENKGLATAVPISSGNSTTSTV
jgi:hypothetical protein